jgi:hypothetical protein
MDPFISGNSTEPPAPSGQANASYALVMLNPWKGVSAAILVTGVACGLIALEITDTTVRRWWALHAFTTGAVAGLVVLLITILVVDQVVRVHQVKNRSQATAAQAAILMAQATRSARTVKAFLQKPDDRDAASDEARTYLTMVLFAAPILIDAAMPRRFLEQAQHLGAELARAFSIDPHDSSAVSAMRASIDTAADGVRKAAEPLVQVLNAQQLAAAGG